MVTPRILKEFIEYDFPGAYINVLEKGQVYLSLVKPSDNLLTAHELFQLIYAKKDEKILRLAIENLALQEYKCERLKKYS